MEDMEYNHIIAGRYREDLCLIFVDGYQQKKWNWPANIGICIGDSRSKLATWMFFGLHLETGRCTWSSNTPYPAFGGFQLVFVSGKIHLWLITRGTPWLFGGATSFLLALWRQKPQRSSQPRYTWHSFPSCLSQLLMKYMKSQGAVFFGRAIWHRWLKRFGSNSPGFAAKKSQFCPCEIPMIGGSYLPSSTRHMFFLVDPFSQWFKNGCFNPSGFANGFARKSPFQTGISMIVFSYMEVS